MTDEERKDLARRICSEEAYRSDNDSWKRFLDGELDHTVWMRIALTALRNCP